MKYIRNTLAVLLVIIAILVAVVDVVAAVVVALFIGLLTGVLGFVGMLSTGLFWLAHEVKAK